MQAAGTGKRADDAVRNVQRMSTLSEHELDGLDSIDILGYPHELRRLAGALAGVESVTLELRDADKLPHELYEIPGLVHLTLASPGLLTALPDGISRLSKLRSLWLGGNRIRRLPADIADMHWLEDLRIGLNYMTIVPPEVWELTSLRLLMLDGNRISRLPAAIGRLTQLEQLGLHGNRLRRLPPEIGALTRLSTLSVSDNRLRELPRELGELTQLSGLYVGDNELTGLPAELTRLKRLSVLAADDNPLADPLPELVERGPDAVLTYLEGLERDGVPLYEAKVLLVGEGEVGKTSLAEALQGHAFQEGRSTTHGIELASLRVPHPRRDVDITLNLWDFGGQEVYRITHQFFFSRRALYLLVWKPRQGRSENAIEEWLQMIRLRVGADARVIIVATHGDERRPELDVTQLRETFGEMVVGQCVVDNKSGRGIAELTGEIATHVARLPQVGNSMSERWVAVRDELSAMSEPQILYRRYEQACRRHRVEGDARKTLLELLHDLGYVVYFGDDEGLRDVVVLQPEWLTKAIGYVLEDEPTRAAGGELDHRRLDRIWRDPKREAYPRRYHPYFLRLMEKFDVSYRIPEQDKSLVSQLVPYERPPLRWDDAPGGLAELSLICVLRDEATGLMPWLTVRTYRFSTGAHWRRGVVLEHPSYRSFALVELPTPLELRLTVRAPAPVYLFSILRDTLEELIRRRWPGLSYDVFVPCPGTGDDGSCTGLFKLRTLERLLAKQENLVQCLECVEKQDVMSLLTGFSSRGADLNSSLAHQTEHLERIESAVARVESGVHQLEAAAADAAQQIRVVRKALAAEVPDCPRLVSLEPFDASAVNPTKLWKTRFRLSLWCEHPAYEHRCDHPGYEFSQPREWYVRAAPFLRTTSKLLRLLPVAGAAAGLLSVDRDKAHAFELRRVRGEIDLMDSVAKQLASPGPGATKHDEPLLESGDAAGLRAVRELLFGLDAARGFAGLRRVLTASGDYLWICPEHYDFYDPGLPRMPAE